MDEATAFMDPSTEAALQKDLERILSKRTALVIAHSWQLLKVLIRFQF